MQRYQCHKIVEAAKVIAVGSGIVRVEVAGLVDGETFPVSPEWLQRFAPEGPRDLGYFVRYADGYESWSPTTAFEAGYEALVDGRVSVDVRRHPGHALHLFFTADEPYERVRQQVRERVEDFLQRAFFGNDADGNPNPVVPAEPVLILAPMEDEVIDGVTLVGFTADQLRELIAIATADPGTVEEIHNRWFHQMVTDGWHFGNTATAANVSSYLRVFHELSPEQQGLLVHELSVVASVPDGRRRLAATGGDLPDDFETN